MKASSPINPIGAKWYKCKGCGEPCGIGPNGICHAKPAELAGIQGTVPCKLFQQCETRAFFEKHMKGEPLPDPEMQEVPDREPVGDA